MVTHDQEEALTIADRIVVMNRGVIEQVGSPVEVYRRPASAFVADFIGDYYGIAAMDLFVARRVIPAALWAFLYRAIAGGGFCGLVSRHIRLPNG